MPAAAQPASDAQILHVINRTSFGPMPGDMDYIRSIGIESYIEQQLHPALLPKVPELEARLSALPALTASIRDLTVAYQLPPDAKDLPEEERKALQKRQQIVLEELTQAKILRAVMSPAQLQEVMTDFWFNHFNVFAEKGSDRLMISAYERDAIRPYALGKFSDLLAATARHPAMLFYLDNWLNTDPNSPIARGKKIGINENYAREIMELHTLGVSGGYTQQDVTTLAHILTGWGLSEGKSESQRTEFFFDARRHDYANQNWLGNPIQGGGENEVETVLDILAHHPSTAHHIAYELAQYFVADEPPQSLVEKLATTFRSSGGDIAAVLRSLFYSPEFWDVKYTGQKFKPPFRYVVSTLRATQTVPPTDMHLLVGAMGQMGEPPYRCLTPNGYANTNDQWMNSDALLKRIDFSKKFSDYLNDQSTQTLLRDLGSNWSETTLGAVRAADPKLRAALLMGSPEFVYY